MSKYVVEILNGKFVYETKREAYRLAEVMAADWKAEVQVYPEEPETFLPNGQQEQATTFGGMCECCLRNPAEEGDFICMECHSRMLIDMESEETDKY